VEAPVLKTIHAGNEPPTRPIEWLVEGFLARGAGTILFGQPGVSKSVHAAVLCAHLALGKDFCGMRVPKSGTRVLYIDLDGGWDWTSQYLHAVFKAHGITGLPEGFHYWSPLDDEDGDDDRPVILEEEGVKIANTVREHGIDLVVIDSLGQFLGGDSNEAHRVSMGLRGGLNPARRQGAAILVIDHATKAARLGGPGVPTPAGSQQKRAWARLTVALEEEETGENTHTVRWTVDKSNTRRFAPFTTRLTFQGEKDHLGLITLDHLGPAGPRKSEEASALEGAKTAILARLQGGSATSGELDAVNGTGARALRDLIAEGSVVREGRGSYSLATSLHSFKSRDLNE
jgi:RecA-family ATPase